MKTKQSVVGTTRRVVRPSVLTLCGQCQYWRPDDKALQWGYCGGNESEQHYTHTLASGHCPQAREANGRSEP
jgi:hypothetical protein